MQFITKDQLGRYLSMPEGSPITITRFDRPLASAELPLHLGENSYRVVQAPDRDPTLQEIPVTAAGLSIFPGGFYTVAANEHQLVQDGFGYLVTLAGILTNCGLSLTSSPIVISDGLDRVVRPFYVSIHNCGPETIHIHAGSQIASVRFFQLHHVPTRSLYELLLDHPL